MMNNYIVYYHRNKFNNKYYVGVTSKPVEQRWGDNGKEYRTSPKFYNAILQYGWNNFDHIIVTENISCSNAALLEKALIKYFDSVNNGYNLKGGGVGINNNNNNNKKESNYRPKTAVICVETGQEFESQNAAAAYFHLHKSSISLAVNQGRTAAGYHFIRKNELSSTPNSLPSTTEKKIYKINKTIKKGI